MFAAKELNRKDYQFGEIVLIVFGQGEFHKETYSSAKLLITNSDGSTVEYDVCEILHKNLNVIDPETGIEIVEEEQITR